MRARSRAVWAALAALWAAAPWAGGATETTRFETRLRFERNQGQSDPAVRFLASGAGYRLFLTDDEAVLALQRPVAQAGERNSVRLERDVVRLRFLGARPASSEALEPQPGSSNYYVGDPSRWRAGVVHYARVSYREVYPGIDLTYYGNDGRLEYDFVLAPGADPSVIRVKVEGAPARIDKSGDLLVALPAGELRQHAPVVYQQQDGARRSVAARYVARGRGEFGVALGGYDRTAALVIDPVLVYSTYLGGTGSATEERADAVAVSPAGYPVVVGFTPSADFPRANAVQGTHGGGQWDAFVTKFVPSGAAVAYSTFLGGSLDDKAADVALDSSGNAYVTGWTASANFPVLNGYGTHNGNADAFVTKLTPSGTLVYSTCLGGNSTDEGMALAVDAAGQVVVVGATYSSNFPTLGAYQADQPDWDGFVTRLAASGSSLVASTYLGGGGAVYEGLRSVAIHAGNGSVYVAGDTESTSFPTVGAYQLDQPGTDGVFAVLAANLASVSYSTYLGGSAWDVVEDIAVDAAGAAYLVGSTDSTDFPTRNAFLGNQPYMDGFLTKLVPVAGQQPAFSTYVGGNWWDYGYSVCVDGVRGVHVAGLMGSSDFPLLNSTQSMHGYDAYVLRFAPSGQSLTYSTLLGGDDMETAFGLALDPAGNAYVVGSTASANHPTVGAYQANPDAGPDGFVAKLSGFAKGDFDRDARADLVFRHQPTGQNDVWLLNGTTRVGSPLTISPAAASLDWQIAGVDDFNRDEKSDLAFWNAVTGQVEFWLMNGTARVGAAVPLSGAAALPPAWKLSATADFNQDGRPDLVWRNTATQKIEVWTMNGTAKLASLIPSPDQAVNANWEIVAATDCNGDGTTDFVWYNPSSGKIVQWLLDDAGVRFTGRFTTPANAGDNNWKVLAAADYGVGPDGPDAAPPQPGTKDLVWRNANSGRVVVWHMDTSGNRTAGLFLTPDAPGPTATEWTIAGPR